MIYDRDDYNLSRLCGGIGGLPNHTLIWRIHLKKNVRYFSVAAPTDGYMGFLRLLSFRSSFDNNRYVCLVWDASHRRCRCPERARVLLDDRATPSPAVGKVYTFSSSVPKSTWCLVRGYHRRGAASCFVKSGASLIDVFGADICFIVHISTGR